DRSQPFVSSPAHLGRLGRERPIQRVTTRADTAPNAKRLSLRPPMRCLRLRCILQSTALPGLDRQNGRELTAVSSLGCSTATERDCQNLILGLTRPQRAA